MTSASYPVGSSPAPSQQSFLIHLQLLTDISRELKTQVEGIAKSVDTVLGLLSSPPAFGPFGEATTLTSWSHDSAAQMQGLLSDVRAAMQFAGEVTDTVATGYAQADDDVSWGLGGSAPVGAVVGIATSSVGAATGALGGITAGLTHAVGQPVDGLGRTVDGVTQGLVDGVGRTVQGVGGTVDGVTGSILGALTGGAPRHAAPDVGRLL